MSRLKYALGIFSRMTPPSDLAIEAARDILAAEQNSSGQKRMSREHWEALKAAVDSASAFRRARKAFLSIDADGSISASAWVPVEEGLPAECRRTLVMVGSGHVIAAHRMDGDWWNPWTNHRINIQVTHWMPIPDPPPLQSVAKQE